MGTLIEYLKAPPPVDTAPADLNMFGLPNYNAPTFRWKLPQTGSEPLQVAVQPPIAAPVRLSSSAPELTSKAAFSERWSGDTTKTASSKVPGAREWLAQQRKQGGPIVLEASSNEQSSSYAEPARPHWLLSAFSPSPK